MPSSRDLPLSSRDLSLSLSDRTLSPRQETFCHSYVYFPNAANAAREAGYEAGSSRRPPSVGDREPQG